MIINNICPFCGDRVKNDKSAGYSKNGSGRFQSKMLYHKECEQNPHVGLVIDPETDQVITTVMRRQYI